MGRHQRGRDEAAVFDFDVSGIAAERGRHRIEPTGPSVPVKAATVAAATGAFFAVGAQLAAGTAAAAPAPVQAGSLPFEVPQGLLPPGFEIPALPGVAAPVDDHGHDHAHGPELPAPLADFIDRVGGAGQWLNDLNPAAPSTVQPVSGTLTSDFGQRWGSHHGGIDIAAPIGTPIKSAADGTVLDAGAASGYGQWVRIANDDGTTAVYGHVDTYQVAAGQRVSAGDQIATVGNQGWSTGPHLHFEVWDQNGTKTDPNGWLNTRGVVADWSSYRAV